MSGIILLTPPTVFVTLTCGCEFEYPNRGPRLNPVPNTFECECPKCGQVGGVMEVNPPIWEFEWSRRL